MHVELRTLCCSCSPCCSPTGLRWVKLSGFRFRPQNSKVCGSRANDDRSNKNALGGERRRASRERTLLTSHTHHGTYVRRHGRWRGQGGYRGCVLTTTLSAHTTLSHQHALAHHAPLTLSRHSRPRTAHADHAPRRRTRRGRRGVDSTGGVRSVPRVEGSGTADAAIL